MLLSPLDHGHLRTYALFIQNGAVVDARYAVQSDSCGAQTLHTIRYCFRDAGRPTSAEQPALYWALQQPC
jgi:hypothetical protein